MTAIVNHVALGVADYDWYVTFFQEVFGMEKERSRGEKPQRQIWFKQGIQLNEVATTYQGKNNLYDHIGFKVDDLEAFRQKALAKGCTELPNKKNWFVLPNQVLVEMKQ